MLPALLLLSVRECVGGTVETTTVFGWDCDGVRVCVSTVGEEVVEFSFREGVRVVVSGCSETEELRE
jgi:hypothetical protein